MTMLSQILAIEKDVKSKHTAEQTALHRTTGQEKFFNGLEKHYRPKDEEGEMYPPEKARVQARATDILVRATAIEADLINVVSMKDVGNLSATADVVVDGVVVLENVPATHLLWLDKRLENVHTFISQIPELDPAEEWNEVESDPGLYRTQARETHKTQKVPKPIVMIEPGEHTEGQAQIINMDLVVGYWDTVKFSAAIPPKRKRALVTRLNKLLRAIRFAREKANYVEVDKTDFGTKITEYLLAE